jgi:hypothetical protein
MITHKYPHRADLICNSKHQNREQKTEAKNTTTKIPVQSIRVVRLEAQYPEEAQGGGKGGKEGSEGRERGNREDGGREE